MRHRSKHPLPTILGAALLAVACADRSTTEPRLGGLAADVSDGAHMDGNADFFFLPPLVDDPSAHDLFEQEDFNLNLSPVVEICRLTEDLNACEASIRTEPATLGSSHAHYQFNWDTGADDLDTGRVYRVFGVVGARRIGHVDVQPVSKGMKNVETGDAFDFQDGRVVPVRMRFENDALCENPAASDVPDPAGPEPCTSKTIDLGEGGTVVLEQTGDRVIVPAQPDRPGELVTLTLQFCDGIPTDLPTFGNCLSITDDPPVEGPLRVPARVLICSLEPEDLLGLNESQQRLLKMYRFEDPVLEALAEASSAECEEFIGTRPTGILRLAHTGWRELVRGVRQVFAPRTLHAATAVLDVGDAGSTEAFSFFQFALPAKMELFAGDGQTAPPGGDVATPPAVRVTDLDGNPVGKARVHFEITSRGGGTVTPAEPMWVLSDPETGVAAATAWTLGVPGRHTARAFGFGIADREFNGPRVDFFDPFTPDITLPLEQQTSVPAFTGQVVFTATATSPAGGTIFRATFTADAVDAPPDVPEIGAWELIAPVDGTILVRSAVGGLEDKPVEVDNHGQADGTPGLHGLVAGTPPTTGTYVARWRSVISEADISSWSTAISLLSGGLPTHPIAVIGYLPAGQLNYGNSTSPDAQVARWTADLAQLFELTVDLDAQTTSLRIDGELVVEDAPFIEAAASIGRIRIGGGGTGANTLGWDDIEISRVAPPVEPGTSSLRMLAQANAVSNLESSDATVADTASDFQDGTVNTLSVGVTALAMNDPGVIEASGTATATWDGPGSGQVVWDVGWDVQELPPSEGSFVLVSALATDDGWIYTFTASQDGVFTLDFDVQLLTANSSGLNPFIFKWFVPDVILPEQQNMLPGEAGTITKALVAGATYTVQINNNSGLFSTGALASSEDARMRGTFQWRVGPPPEP